MQKVISYTAFSEASMYVACPQCKRLNTISLDTFTTAINRNLSMVCPACKVDFTISLICQTRDAQQRNEAIGELAGESNNMELCGNCGTPRFIHGAILEACPKCGDDETDLAMREEFP